MKLAPGGRAGWRTQARRHQRRGTRHAEHTLWYLLLKTLTALFALCQEAAYSKRCRDRRRERRASMTGKISTAEAIDWLAEQRR